MCGGATNSSVTWLVMKSTIIDLCDSLSHTTVPSVSLVLTNIGDVDYLKHAASLEVGFGLRINPFFVVDEFFVTRDECVGDGICDLSALRDVTYFCSLQHSVKPCLVLVTRSRRIFYKPQALFCIQLCF